MSFGGLLNKRKDTPPSAGCANSEHGIKVLYDENCAPLVGHLKAYFHSCPQQAEEVAHDAFEKVVTHNRSNTIENIKAFLWRTANNLAISRIRSQKVAHKYEAEARHLFSTDHGYLLNPERVLEAKEKIKIVKDALRIMPKQRRRAFILTRIENLSHAQASQRMGISRPAVSKHVAKAMTDIHAALHNAQDDKAED